MDHEKELVQKLKSYDPEALRQLMDQYGTTLLRFIYLLVKDQHLAEDLSQETFLRAFQKISQFKGDGSLKSWLIKIALNLARKQMKKSYFHMFFPKIFNYNDLIDSAPLPDQYVFRSELTHCVHNLPYLYREVILLYYYQELSIKEISALLQEREGTIKSKLARARVMLKERLESGGWADEGKAGSGANEYTV